MLTSHGLPFVGGRMGRRVRFPRANLIALVGAVAFWPYAYWAST